MYQDAPAQKTLPRQLLYNGQMIDTLLGELTPKEFLATYWQKKPLLVRGALPGFGGIFTKSELLELATDENMESRFVSQDAEGCWQLERGPFKPSRFRPKTPWSVLVSGTNLVSDAADILLRHFNFIPYTRLDDLMVSYATAGGGVGPHFDSYDVFLIQGLGKRRWQISAQRDFTLVEGAPLRLLKNFKPTREWVLEPGDMLYLPPQYAHNGISESVDCMTYSVGFRAPTNQEIGEAFLGHIQETLSLAGRYADAGITPSTDPARIGEDVIDRIETMLQRIRWSRKDVSEFVGRYMSEPKPQVFFDPPDAPLSLAQFAKTCAKRGFKLDLRTQLLHHGKRFYLNGEAISCEVTQHAAIKRLASERKLAADQVNPELVCTLYEWYCDGFGWPG